MKIGIISDTHDHHQNILAAVDLFQQRGVQIVLHAGDIVSPFAARPFERLKPAPFIAVFGNNEGERLMLKSVVNGFGGEINEYCYKGILAGKSVFMTHTPHSLDEVVRSGMYDLVIYGHTHQLDLRREGKTLVINPGEATDWLTGQGHVVLLDTEDMSCEVLDIP